MHVPFDNMPGDARLWVYQADRPFTEAEKQVIETGLLHLCENWAAHGVPLRTSYRLDFNNFIILAVDERAAGASGCSIDGSVRLLKEMQKSLGLDFFDRQRVAFLEGTSVHLHPVVHLKKLFETGVLSAESVTFNNALTTKADWEQAWQVAAKNSWVSRYLPKPAGVP